MKKIFGIVLIILILVACGGGNGQNNVRKEGEIKWNPNGSKEVAYVLPNVGPYYDQKWYGVKEELTKLGYEPIMYDAGGYKNTKRQIEIMDNLIQKRVAGIILHPTSSEALVNPVEQAIKMQIPVISENVKVFSGKITAEVMLNNSRNGWEIAMSIVNELKGEGNVIALVGPPGHEQSATMWEAAKRYFSEFPGIKIVKEEYLPAKANDALKVTESLLTAKSDVNAIYCWYVQNAIGAAQAVKAAGIEPNRIVIVAKDINPEGENLLKEGYISALLVGTPIDMGRTSARVLDSILKGKPYSKLSTLNNYLVTADYIDKIRRTGFEISK